jgi:probable HAF family extracellular repeat protein
MDVTADGSVVVGARFFGDLVGSPNTEPFRWTESEGMVGLGYLPNARALEGRAWAVSGDGQVIVGASRSGSSIGVEAFRWTQAGGMVGLGDLPGGRFNSTAVDVSIDGSVIVGNGTVEIGNNDNVSEAFRWTQSTGMVSLGQGTYAHAISDDGAIIVGTGLIQSSGNAVLWGPGGGMHPIMSLLEAQGIDMSGWKLFEANGVSADGRVIVGRAQQAGGPLVNYVAIIPEPTALCMMASMAAMALSWARGRLSKD